MKSNDSEAYATSLDLKSLLERTASLTPQRPLSHLSWEDLRKLGLQLHQFRESELAKLQDKEYQEAYQQGLELAVDYLPSTVDDMIVLAGMLATVREQKRILKRNELLEEQIREELQIRKQQENEIRNQMVDE